MARAFRVPLSSGDSVSALHYLAETPRAALILAHGAGAGQSHPFMVRTAAQLADGAIEVYTFNFPYLERKRSAPDKPDVLEACYLDVVRAVSDQVGSRPLFIGGKSMGGRIATQIAARPDFSGVSGIVVLGYPLHPPGRADTLRVKHLPAIRVPMLIVQGTRDAFGSPDELGPHFTLKKSRVTIHPIEKGDHSFVVSRTRATQAMVEAGIIDTVSEWILHAGRP